MRTFVLAGIVVVANACDRSGPGAPLPPPPAAPHAELAAEVAIARAGCARCHATPGAAGARAAPMPGPPLADAPAWRAGDALAAFLRDHHGRGAEADLAAWVRSLAAGAGPLQPAAVSAAAIARGERLFRELACQACHAPSALDALAARTDHAHLARFLVAPAAHRPGVVHDFLLDAGEADSLAAFLLRTQQSKSATAELPGFAFECFEVQVTGAAMPELAGLPAAAQGVARRIDVAPRTRDDHFVLRWRAMLDVPAAGEWRFTCGSDDGSWLWIDDRLVVENAAIAPHRRKHGTVQLTAGLHALTVLYTEAAGGQSLEVLWRGPGVEQQEIPADRAVATSIALVPPAIGAAPEPAAVQRGREQAVARRCAACHAVSDPAMAAVPPPAPARPWQQLGDGPCPHTPGAAAIRQAASLQRPLDVVGELAQSLLRDGCLGCHARDGGGGLPAVVRQGLAEVEDLGDEGRLPPDLSGAGHRLRQAWIEKVLAEGHKARPYVKVRMPRLPADRARRYAELFAAVDGVPGDDREPPFSVEQAQRGQHLAGTGGRNCVTCHPFAGHRALGAQGMDLAFQHERVKPAWFADWLLHPTRLRPGTRMLPLWLKGDAADRGEVDAVRTWLSLGSAAPLPPGIGGGGRELVLEPIDRPILHGAFLQGLSARCIAVGSPERTHYAYDIEHARLAWLWRGAFLDADGTWSGRAGKLLQPLGDDRVVLDGAAGDFDAEPAAGESRHREVLGRRVDADGYPIWRVRVGTAEFEDHLRPRLAEGGSEFVRTLRVARGRLRLGLPAPGGPVRLELLPAGVRELDAGASVQIVYRW